jgi:hypothetical protein
MGMYTELNIGVQLSSNKKVIHKLRYMLNEKSEDIEIQHPLFTKTERWKYMLLTGSYYFDGQADSKLYEDNLYKDDPMYFLNVRCNLKNYCSEIELFLDWLCPYIKTEGFIGYMRYEDDDNPVLIYKKGNEIAYKKVR